MPIYVIKAVCLTNANKAGNHHLVVAAFYADQNIEALAFQQMFEYGTNVPHWLEYEDPEQSVREMRKRRSGY